MLESFAMEKKARQRTDPIINSREIMPAPSASPACALQKVSSLNSGQGGTWDRQIITWPGSHFIVTGLRKQELREELQLGKESVVYPERAT